MTSTILVQNHGPINANGLQSLLQHIEGDLGPTQDGIFPPQHVGIFILHEVVFVVPMAMGIHGGWEGMACHVPVRVQTTDGCTPWPHCPAIA